MIQPILRLSTPSGLANFVGQAQYSLKLSPQHANPSSTNRWKKSCLAVSSLAILFSSPIAAHTRITALENNSSNPAHLISSQLMIEPRTKRPVMVPLQLMVDPQTRRQFALTIPTIESLHGKYREQFIAGDPYFPDEALQIQTCAGTFALWQDKSGIMQALQFVPGVTMRDACVPQCVVRNHVQQSDYTLVIAADGAIQLF